MSEMDFACEVHRVEGSLAYHMAAMFALLLLMALVQAPPKKVDIVSVTGCLREQGTNWMLVAATEPVPSVANQAQGKEIPSEPPAGKNTFRLIGTFDDKVDILSVQYTHSF